MCTSAARSASVSYTHLDPEKLTKPEDMPVLDRWLLTKLNELIEKAEQSYCDYEFHIITHEMCIRDSGMHASLTLADALKKLGLPLRRFKTGTPPRVNARSVDFSQDVYKRQLSAAARRSCRRGDGKAR